MRKKKDMYMPDWLCALGIILLIVGVVCIVISIKSTILAVIGTIISLPLGIAAILCWKNQWLEMEGYSEFVYSTMFGKKHRYRFSEVKYLKYNTDSMTLILENGKVHIESCAILSNDFSDRLEKIYVNEGENV